MTITLSPLQPSILTMVLLRIGTIDEDFPAFELGGQGSVGYCDFAAKWPLSLGQRSNPKVHDGLIAHT